MLRRRDPEAQHIGGVILAAVPSVQRTHTTVADDGDVHRAANASRGYTRQPRRETPRVGWSTEMIRDSHTEARRHSGRSFQLRDASAAGAPILERLVRLHDLLNELVPDDVAFVEMNEGDSLYR